MAMRTHFVCVSGGAGLVAGAEDLLLRQDLGAQPGCGQPVTVRHALEAAGLDAANAARRLVALPPDLARAELTAVLRRFHIAGHPCPDPLDYATAALRRIGVEFMPHPFAAWRPRFAVATAVALAGLALAFL